MRDCNNALQQHTARGTTHGSLTHGRGLRKGGCDYTLQQHTATATNRNSLTHGRALGKCAPTRCKSTLQLQTHTVRQHVATVHCNCKYTLQQHISSTCGRAFRKQWITVCYSYLRTGVAIRCFITMGILILQLFY